MSKVSPQGFTLVELLLVMVLLGLISVLLFDGLRTTARSAGHGTAVLYRASDMVLAANFLRSLLADARPLPDGEDAAIAFTGGPDRLAMVGVPPAYLASGGFYRIEIALDRGKHVLAAGWIPLSSDDATGKTAASPLLDHVVGAEFGYFGVLSGDEAPSWHDAWAGQGTLPILVRLRIGFADGTVAPDVIVAVRTAPGASR